ncbi:copper resistance CopC/CopD family protein [Streptomyces dubilierae]|uniref:Copper resistance protein CopC n=1 Tax=Streptomyces dubilierae TaxID=3075533 RepID=A0ABU2PNW8_9ACTN|nr:copper resistance protein CopC [Streptomyces sp. DSM 41921]MDT0392460.1 copper resistance protein CopC [Streptomyces sp. DSM 41921]
MLLGTVLVLLLGGAAPAPAHSALRGTDPEDGSVVPRAPRHLTLTFTESVGLLDDSFRVFGPDRRRVPTGEVTHADGRSDTARIRLTGKLAQGTYAVAWRVVSADSHPVSGAFTFSVGKRSASTVQIDTGPEEDPLTDGLYDLARYLAYLAAALLVGTAAFVSLCRPAGTSPLRRPLAAAWWTLLGATAALLLLRAPYETGAGPLAAFDAGALERTLSSRPGRALLARLVILLLIAAFLVRSSRSRDHTRPVVRASGTALAVALALTWAMAEHASAGIQVPVAMASSVLHLLATGVWLGGLVALLLTLRRASVDGLAEVVPRFSRVAFTSVAVLAVTGLYQSWRGLGSLSALTGTSYGRLLLAKLAAVTVLLWAAGHARRWTARIAAPAPTARTAVPERVAQPVGAHAAATGPAPTGASATGTLAPGPADPGSGDPGAGAPDSADPEQGITGSGEPTARSAGPERSGKPADRAPVTGGAGGGSAGSGSGTPADSEARRRGLRRSVLVEVAVAAVVLALTTVLTGTLPGRAEAEAARQAPAGALPPTAQVTVPFDTGTGGMTGRGTVQVTLDPARVGDNGVQAVVYGADTGLVVVPEVRVTFSLPSRDLGPIDAELTDRGGYWSTNAVNLPLPGTWTMKTTVRVSDVDQVTEEKRVRIVP